MLARHRHRIRQHIQQFAFKVLTTFYRRIVVLVAPLNEDIAVRYTRVEVTIASLQESEIDAYLRFRRDQRREEVIDRLRCGDRCFACWHDGAIVDSGWVATREARLSYLRARPQLDAGDISVYDTFTAPAYRGRGLYMARNYAVAYRARQEGRTRSVAFVAAENRAPLVLLRRWGYRQIGIYRCWRLGPWQILRAQRYAAEPLPVLAPDPPRRVPSRRPAS